MSRSSSSVSRNRWLFPRPGSVPEAGGRITASHPNRDDVIHESEYVIILYNHNNILSQEHFF